MSDTGVDSFRSIAATSPKSKRNTKNLSLQLKRPGARDQTQEPQQQQQQQQQAPPQVSRPAFAALRSPIPQSPSVLAPPPGLFRHPSMSRTSDSKPTLVRRATLSLSIPSEPQTNKSNEKLSSNSMSSFSSSSPLSSSPIVPFTPEFVSASKRSTHSSSSTLTTMPVMEDSTKTQTQTQTLVQQVNSMDISDDGDTHKMNAYPNGPLCVLEPNLFLYSEPTLQQVTGFDLVINVARELTPPMLKDATSLENTSLQHYTHDSTEYYYVPWTHTSKLCPDLPLLTQLMLAALKRDKRVLIHCQCGVSRSASLIVACLMKLHHIPLNDAYTMLKEKAPDISPNMSLIFSLMEWGELIGVNPKSSNSGYSPMEIAMDPLGVEGSKVLYES